MSATSGHGLRTAGSSTLARQVRLRRTLESYGVLTRNRLYELAGASHWRVTFDVALERAIEAGRVRRLGADLYEAGPEE
jgi:hypothetical protein